MAILDSISRRWSSSSAISSLPPSVDALSSYVLFNIPLPIFYIAFITFQHLVSAMSLVVVVRWISSLLIALSPFPWQISSVQTSDPITLADFNNIFTNASDPNRPGGCSRTLGTSIRDGIGLSLAALNDALNMTKGALDQVGYDSVDGTDKGKTLRQFLFLFFGFRFDPFGGVDMDNWHDYQYVRGM